MLVNERGVKSQQLPCSCMDLIRTGKQGQRSHRGEKMREERRGTEGVFYTPAASDGA